MQAPASQPLTGNLGIQSFQWQPETYDHRHEVGGDGGKVPYMIISDLPSPPSPPSGGSHKLLLTMGVG